MAKTHPYKFSILEIMVDGKERWNNELVGDLQKIYGEPSGYSRDTINFDVVELAAGGMLKEIAAKVDEEGTYKKGAVLHKYVITPYGKDKAVFACVVKEN